jgi:hypothetical protein
MKPYLLLFLVAVGCDSTYVDRRPLADRQPPPAPIADLAGVDLTGVDLAGLERLLADGTFVGRAGHNGSGGGQLYRRVDGGVEVRLASDFTVSGVPAPVVYLTSRADMGNTIDAQADVDLGIPKFSGAQVFPVPAGAEAGRRNVFIYCRSFRVEVAKAALVDK